MFSFNIFRDEFNVTIPSHYRDLITRNENAYFRLELNSLTGENVVYSLEGSFPTKFIADLSLNVDEPPAISLPWNEKHWNLYVTHVNHSNEIWCQLFGEEYRSKFEKIYAEMEEQQGDFEKVNVRYLREGKYYLAKYGGIVQRVRFMELDDTRKRVKVFCIDTGEEIDKISVDNLFVCDKKFLQVAGQAVAFSLHGLEIFSELEEVSICCDKLLGFSYVGVVLDSQEEYEKQCQLVDDPKIDVILYDTSKDPEVNMNQKILTTAKPQFPVASIKANTLEHITITEITNNGEIACVHTQSSTTYTAMSMITEIISQISSKPTFTQAQGFYENSTADCTDLYLVRDRKRNEKLFRAKFLQILGTNRILMYLIDLGIEAEILKDDVYRLDELHPGLNIFPAQGMRIRLDQINTKDMKVMKLLRGLVKPGNHGICKLKSIDKDGVPLVRLLIINEGQNNRAINDLIIDQTKLRSSSENIHHSITTMPEETETEEQRKIAEGLRLGKLYPPLPLPKIPDVGNYMEVKVLESQTPKLFYIHTNRSSNEFNRMMANLQKYGRNVNIPNVSFGDIIVDIEYAAYRALDKRWCR